MSSSNDPKNFTTLKEILDKATEENIKVDELFEHEHYISNVDGVGAVTIVSLFKLKQYGASTSYGCTTSLIVRVQEDLRDHILAPGVHSSCEKICQYIIRENNEKCAAIFVKTSFELCKKIVQECLHRMRMSAKNITNDDQRSIIKFYSLGSVESPLQLKLLVSPPPDIDSLWLTLQRTPFSFWNFSEQLREAPIPPVLTKENFSAFAINALSGDENVRNTLFAILQYQAIWLDIQGENTVASWLRWEAYALLGGIDPRTAFEQSLVANILIVRSNKQLKLDLMNSGSEFIMAKGSDPRSIPNKSLYDYFLFSSDYNFRGGQVHPDVHFITDIAKIDIVREGIARVTAAAAGVSDSTSITSMIEPSDILIVEEVSSNVSIKEQSKRCAICGYTVIQQLQKCSKCLSVCYCSRNHQILHWRNGHKDQCQIGVGEVLSNAK